MPAHCPDSSCLIASLLSLLSLISLAAAAPLAFEKVRLSDERFEAACACDVDGDGHLDIVSGGWWYAGPDFKQRNKLRDVPAAGEYFDDFHDFPLDVNGDGRPDIITGGWFGKTLYWAENPGPSGGDWKLHEIARPGSIETTRFWDVDGDGFPEVCPNSSGNVIFWRLDRDAEGKGKGTFSRYVVRMKCGGHGLGFGDIDGDGRGDFVVPRGWLQAPANPLTEEWTWHSEFDVGHASVPILVHDVNGDGRADLIVGQAHGYGLHWWEQGVGANGERTWTRHVIDEARSQYHDMQLVDLDNDGQLELVTGKRYRAHNGKDPGSSDPLFVSYFKIDGGRFERVDIDLGPPQTSSGVGIYFWVEDLDGNGWKDIIAPGKEGLYLFKNLGPRER